jgi:hypothetical protein
MTTTETAADRQRRLARERQQRRRARLAATTEPLADRYCLACRQLFQPRRRDSWLCSRRCVERVSFHRKQARSAELGAILRQVRQHLHGEQNPLTTAQLRDRWAHYPREVEASYSLWFPDLCGLTAEQAQADRELFQQLCREAEQQEVAQ